MARACRSTRPSTAGVAVMSAMIAAAFAPAPAAAMRLPLEAASPAPAEVAAEAAGAQPQENGTPPAGEGLQGTEVAADAAEASPQLNRAPPAAVGKSSQGPEAGAAAAGAQPEQGGTPPAAEGESSQGQPQVDDLKRLAAQANKVYMSALDMDVPTSELEQHWSELLGLRRKILRTDKIPGADGAPEPGGLDGAPTAEAVVAVAEVAPGTEAGSFETPATQAEAEVVLIGGLPGMDALTSTSSSAETLSGDGGLGFEIAPGPSETDYKSLLSQVLSRKLKRPMTKVDLVYTTDSATDGVGFVAFLVGARTLSREYGSGESAPSKRSAEHRAARAALLAEFPEALGDHAARPPALALKQTPGDLAAAGTADADTVDKAEVVLMGGLFGVDALTSTSRKAENLSSSGGLGFEISPSPPDMDENLSSGGGLGFEIPPGPPDMDYKSLLNQQLSRKLKRPMTKEDLVYTTHSATGGVGFVASLVGASTLSREYKSDEADSSKRSAEHRAARAALLAEFPEALDDLVAGPPSPALKRKLAPTINEDPISQLAHAAQRLLGRPCGKSDVVYDVTQLDGNRFQATVGLPAYNAQVVHQGHPAESKKQAKRSAAEEAIKGLSHVIAPMEEVRKAKKANTHMSMEQLGALKAKDAVAKAAAVGEAQKAKHASTQMSSEQMAALEAEEAVTEAAAEAGTAPPADE